MKKKLTVSIMAVVLFLSLSLNVLAAVQWSGSKDVQEAKDKIVTITDLFRRKNETISGLKETNKNNESAIKEKDKTIRDKDKVIADKEKAILDKEKAIREKETVIKQLEDRVSEKETVIANLERDLDNLSSKHKEELEQAKKDVKELNELLGEVLEENK